MLRPKKVGALPTGKDSDEVKQTNEIKFAPILLDDIVIKNKDITSDALHTQVKFADYLVEERKAHYYFCVKGNQATLLADIEYHFEQQLKQPDYEDEVSIAHGRIEIRRIWTTTALNQYLKFPHTEQVYNTREKLLIKKVAKKFIEIAYGITSRTPKEACPKTILHKVRGHWSIEICHYIIDWIYDEDRSTIRMGFGPENMTRLRRFAIGLVKSKSVKSVSKKMRELNWNTRAVLDYLKITTNRKMAYRA